jgi:hypothetical protein
MPKLETEDMIVVRRYEYNGAVLFIEINKISNRISFVEPSKSGDYKPQTFKFAGRGLEYMQGWYNVLEGMRKAMIDARDELDAWEKQEDERRLKEEVALQKALQDNPF